MVLPRQSVRHLRSLFTHQIRTLSSSSSQQSSSHSSSSSQARRLLSLGAGACLASAACFSNQHTALCESESESGPRRRKSSPRFRGRQQRDGKGAQAGDSPFIVISGSGHPQLAGEVAQLLGTDLGEANISKFQDGEINVNIRNKVRGHNVYVIHPTCSPVNDNLMELLLLVSCLRRASAEKIFCIIPYYGYARQDRLRAARDTIAASDVALMLTAMGADKVVTIDAHRGQLVGFFSAETPIDNLEPFRLAKDYFMGLDLQNPVVVSPSPTGVYRSKLFKGMLHAEGLNASIGFVTPADSKGRITDLDDSGSHHRVTKDQAEILVGDVENCDVILVDDMVDTGSRMVAAARTCKRLGAQRVFAFATHGLFSGDAMQSIDDSDLDALVITDTVPLDQKNASEKIVQISVAPLIAEAIRRIQTDKSLSALSRYD